MNWLRFIIVPLTAIVLATAYYYHRTFQNGFGLLFAGLAVFVVGIQP
jgi:hypothetical protein